MNIEKYKSSIDFFFCVIVFWTAQMIVKTH